MNEKQERFVRTLVDSRKSFSNSEIIERLKRLGLFISPPFVVCEMKLEIDNPYQAVIDDVSENVIEIIEKKTAIYNALCCINSYENIQIIFSYKTFNYEQILNTINEEIYKEYKLRSYISICDKIDDYKDIAFGAMQTHEALNYKSYFHNKNIYYVQDTKHMFSNSLMRYTDIYDSVINAFLVGDNTKMYFALSTLAETLRQKPNSNKTSIRRSMIEVVIRIINIATYSDINVDEVLKGVDPYKAILSMTKTEEIITWIMKLSKELTDRSQHNIKTDNVNIKKAINFIDENIKNYNLSLGMISENLNLNSSYFSKLFKDSIGISVTDYISNIRTLRAKKLLIETKMSIKEISIECGFVESSYFSIVFKRKVGMTPLKFRNRM